MTYSVVMRDPATGAFGVAVQSHWFNVGRIVPWVRAGVGAVATQSLAEPLYGPRGLDLMASGVAAPDALARLLEADPERAVRQVAVIDASGRVAAHTGDRCIAHAAHIVGEGWSVQANIMRNAQVVPAMAAAAADRDGTLGERLVRTLEAAEATGGDLRGSQSAALIVSGDGPIAALDLRVEDSPDPISEMRRLVGVEAAYRHMSTGDEALARGDGTAAAAAYAAAATANPSNPEIGFWRAHGLATIGLFEEAAALIRAVVLVNPDLADLLSRLPAAGLIAPDVAVRLHDDLTT
jgi:uncharacterized Ntn-hydrolase superfamily protein